jgi:hypothetical protein
MARPKTQITERNMFHFLEYFESGLNKSDRLFDKLKKSVREEARSAFTEIRESYYLSKSAQRGEFIAQLQEWIDTYLSKADWDRCLAAFRQAKYHKREKRFAVKIPVKAYTELKRYAKAVHLPLGEAIYQAVKNERQRLSEQRSE